MPAVDSYAQWGQDQWALANSRNPGVFVEVGASDGVYLSNTLLLEKAGWAGLCIEPGRSFEALRQNRKCHVDPSLLWCVPGVQLDFVESTWSEAHGPDDLGQLSHIFAKPSVWNPSGTSVLLSTDTLTHILRKYRMPQYIDYLSLDVEGAEFEVLCGIDFAEYQFGRMTIEHNNRDADQITRLLAEFGYAVVRELELENWYALASFGSHS